jgi:hypothetical protein
MKNTQPRPCTYLKVESDYECRFLNFEQKHEALELWRMSPRTGGRYNRMLWVSERMATKYPDLSSTAIYKDLDGLLGPFPGRILV